jgi:hypothetical protein
MRTILKIMTFLWIAFWLFIGTGMILDTPNQIKLNKEFIDKEIKPSVDFVKNFINANDRFPTNREYYTWVRDYHKEFISDLKQSNDSLIYNDFGGHVYIRNFKSVRPEDTNKFEKANWDKDFAIGVWEGDYIAYYYSWTDRYDSDNYTWFDGF